MFQANAIIVSIPVLLNTQRAMVDPGASSALSCGLFVLIGASSFQKSDINACKNAPFQTRFTTLRRLKMSGK
jgi:hypothetical protein